MNLIIGGEKEPVGAISGGTKAREVFENADTFKMMTDFGFIDYGSDIGKWAKANYAKSLPLNMQAFSD